MFNYLDIPTSLYSFGLEDIVALSVFLVFFIIQLMFYLAYYRIPLVAAQKKNDKASATSPKVSIIIESENEVENLETLLPMLLEQDYPDFEVIVINNGSTDESENLLEQLKIKYSSLYSTYIPHSRDTKLGFRKLALTVGIKAAKGDVILMTEIYCRPVSKKWISSMMEYMGSEKSVVLGYSYFEQRGAFFNRIARFDNFLFSLQYLSAAIKKRPYTGVYRNIAFRKELFFKNKGFAKYLYLENGEDVFFNQVTTSENTAVCLDSKGFTKTIIESFSLWKKMKKSYSVARSCFRGSMANLFSFEYISRYAFYLLYIVILILSFYLNHLGTAIIASILLFIRLGIQLSVLNRSSTYFKSGKFIFSLPMLDLLQPLYNIRFRTNPPKRRF